MPTHFLFNQHLYRYLSLKNASSLKKKKYFWHPKYLWDKQEEQQSFKGLNYIQILVVYSFIFKYYQHHYTIHTHIKEEDLVSSHDLVS